MTTRIRAGALTASVLALASLGSVALAHEDDPKLRDRQPRFEGPGITTGVPGQNGSGTIAASSGVSFANQDVTLLSWLSLADFGSFSAGNDCWGYTSPSGREYAIMGLSSATAFVEITDPNNPVIVSIKTGPSSTWRDMKVFQTYCYAVSEGGNGIQVFNMANIDNGTVQTLGEITTGGTTATHNVAVDTTSGYLYRCGGSSEGLRIYNLNNNPAVPQFVNSWSTKYVHDAEIYTYTSGPLNGAEIAYCSAGFNGGFSNTGLTILDVSNKNSISILQEVFWPNPGYSHQVWLSEDEQYLYLNDELDEGPGVPTTTYVFDVSNPSQAFLAGSFTNNNEAVGHNLYVRGNQLFEANYRSGLRVFDITNPLSPIETNWFDTYPSDDAPSFNGLWSCYPFFPSGVVIGSDIEKGLFVWWVGQKLVDIQPTGVVPSIINPRAPASACRSPRPTRATWSPARPSCTTTTAPASCRRPWSPRAATTTTPSSRPCPATPR